MFRQTAEGSKEMNSAPAYHLRTNKSVERMLFIELLHRLSHSTGRHIERYSYVGFGGPFLEDFNLIHSAFGCTDMVSLEVDKHILTRQKMNMPNSCARLTTTTAEEFVRTYKTGRKPLIVWFDHTGNDWSEYISNCCELLRKLPAMSVFKLTLPGRTNWLGSQPESKLQKLTELFANYGPFVEDDVYNKNICGTLYRITKQIVAESLPDSTKRIVRFLASYWYDDSTPMLTITMIIGYPERVNDILQSKAIKKWPFANQDKPIELAIPSLGLREKLAIDSLLPGASPQHIMKTLELRFESKYSDSIQVMRRYVDLYRHAPTFVRIAG